MGKERFIEMKTARELRNEQKLKCLIGIVSFIVLVLTSALIIKMLIFTPVKWAKTAESIYVTTIRFAVVFIIDTVVLLGLSNYLVMNKARIKDYYKYRKSHWKMEKSVYNVLYRILYVNKFYKREGSQIIHPKSSSTYLRENGKHLIRFTFYRDGEWEEEFQRLDEVLEEEFQKPYDSKDIRTSYIAYEYFLK